MKNNILIGHKIGFSLVELLISLIVISCITAAFTPLITKKFSSGVFGGGGSVSDISADCDKFGPNCNLCTSNFCLSCTGLTCVSDEYKDNKSCTCKKCTEKYGDYCTKCTEEKCLTCLDGQYLDENQNCKPCTNKFSNCSSCTLYQCNACKDGYILIDPTSTSSCTEFNCSSPNFMQIGNLCITKYNMGDSVSLGIPSEVNIVESSETCNPGSAIMCCWKGNTSGGCDNGNGGGYSGCNRTVCDHNAAEYICENFNGGGYDWRLPTSTELSTWNIYSLNLGTDGIQLCDYYSGYNSAQCLSKSSCIGSADVCRPHDVWSSTQNSSGLFYIYYLQKGAWKTIAFKNANAISVRCVAVMPQTCAERISEGCLTCEGDNCLSCDTGYILKDGKCKIDCATKFGTNCTECTQDKCTACADGYILDEKTKALPVCKTSPVMQIGSLLVTKYNVNDHPDLVVSSNCTRTGMGGCDNANGGAYSGCNRTVCYWWDASSVCSQIKYGGYSWRLPRSRGEVSSWGGNSINRGVNGLQLCDPSANRGSARCVATSYVIWTSEFYDGSKIYSYLLQNASWIENISLQNNLYSVRCVANI